MTRRQGPLWHSRSIISGSTSPQVTSALDPLRSVPLIEFAGHSRTACAWPSGLAPAPPRSGSNHAGSWEGNGISPAVGLTGADRLLRQRELPFPAPAEQNLCARLPHSSLEQSRFQKHSLLRRAEFAQPLEPIEVRLVSWLGAHTHIHTIPLFLVSFASFFPRSALEREDPTSVSSKENAAWCRYLATPDEAGNNRPVNSVSACRTIDS